MIGTKVLGRRCCINEEELLGPSNCVHCCCYLLPCFSCMPLHVHLFQDPLRYCPFKEVFCVFVGALALQFQGLELGQEVINPLVGPLTKTQELGPCPLLVIPWEKEVLDLHLECCPCGPHICRHALIQADLCEAARMRAFQTRVNSHCLLLVSGSGMGGGNPNLNFGPPFVELLGRPVIGLRGCDNLLLRNGTRHTWDCICCVGEELGKHCSEVLLILDELLDRCFLIHG